MIKHDVTPTLKSAPGRWWAWCLTCLAGGVPVVTQQAHQKLLEAIDEFNAEIEAQRKDDEEGTLR
jgi:hypothetical protein